MKYLGGKYKISTKLSEYINGQIQEGQTYWEPFCGALSVASKISGPRPMLLSDLHQGLISMWRQAWVDPSVFPTSVTREDWEEYKNDLTKPDYTRAFIGFGCSQFGCYFRGYRYGKPDVLGGYDPTTNPRTTRESIERKLRSLLVNGNTPEFRWGDYQSFTPLVPTLIYCDPPYRGTSGYSTGRFDHSGFNLWVKQMTGLGHRVLVSEYSHNLPEGATELWRCESKQSIRDLAQPDRPPKDTIEILYEYQLAQT